jgi:hypothetical protein
MQIAYPKMQWPRHASDYSVDCSTAAFFIIIPRLACAKLYRVFHAIRSRPIWNLIPKGALPPILGSRPSNGPRSAIQIPRSPTELPVLIPKELARNALRMRPFQARIPSKAAGFKESPVLFPDLGNPTAETGPSKLRRQPFIPALCDGLSSIVGC